VQLKHGNTILLFRLFAYVVNKGFQYVPLEIISIEIFSVTTFNFKYILNKRASNLLYYFLFSGSEEAKVYLWDKHYQCLISTLQHEEGVVNGLEFNPRDYECVVTSGDDHTIRIWRSRNRMKSLRKQSCH